MPKEQKEKTPIEETKNLGPVMAWELSQLEIRTLEDLKKTGFERTCFLLVDSFPKRLNLNAFYSLYGAIENKDWRSLSEEEKKRIKELYQTFKK